MQYPLISEYVRAIQDASSNLDKLAHLVPVLDDHGEPYRSSGAFAVVFKMKGEQTGKLYALKCFTEEQEGRAEAYRKIADELECVDSSYITSVKYLEKEIFVDSSCEEDEFSVLLMDWIDGETMESYIAENYQDNYAMAMLCYRFCKMAAWLRSQPFAHGDIKPDNIMVRPDGSLTLVDYDGMFVPAMKGQKSPTIGTKDFSHPQRTIDDFDKTIDDFALVSIALSLKAISLKPSLLDEFGAADRLLFSVEDYRDLSKSKILVALQELMVNNELLQFYSLFLLAYTGKNLSMFSSCFIRVEKPYVIEMLDTKVTDEEIENAVMDKYGIKYSKDGQRLLKADRYYIVGQCTIESKIKVICDNAFEKCEEMSSVVLPASVTNIGHFAFSACQKLSFIDIPENVIGIGDCAFQFCHLETVILPKSLKSIGNGAFFADDFTSIVLPEGLTKIGIGAFSSTGLISVDIPKGVTHIANNAFGSCLSLTSVILPNGLTTIDDNAFCDCWELSSITLPKSIKTIGKNAFASCFKLDSQIREELISRFGKEVFGE